VGAFPSGAQHLLPDALAYLRGARHDISLTLLHFEPPDGLTQLVAGQVDAVLTHRYPGVSWPVPTGVRLLPVRDDPLILMTPRSHPLAGTGPVDITRLRDEVFISGTANDANRVALESACATARFRPVVSFETTDYAVTATLVAKGFGVAFVPLLAWPSATYPVSPVGVQVGGMTFARRIALAQRSGERSPLVRELLEYLRDDRPAPDLSQPT
jgi:DNA-binding transcriptional LysR family regulator